MPYISSTLLCSHPSGFSSFLSPQFRQRCINKPWFSVVFFWTPHGYSHFGNLCSCSKTRWDVRKCILMKDSLTQWGYYKLCQQGVAESTFCHHEWHFTRPGRLSTYWNLFKKQVRPITLGTTNVNMKHASDFNFSLALAMKTFNGGLLER